MEPIISRCGYRCDLCLAYAPNVAANPSNRQKLSDGWYQYYGFRILPEDIFCDGCRVENPKLIDTHCKVRSCVIDWGLDNCSECAAYVCDKLLLRIVEIDQWTDANLPEDDYQCFIRPYENKRRLDALRIQGE